MNRGICRFLVFISISMLPVKVFGLGPEKWVKYTCRGPVTPKGKVPIIYKDVMVAHFRITADGVPSAKQLYELNAPRFQAVSDLCSERRWQQTDRSGWTGNAGHTSYLDWETDLLYERYIISSVEFNPEFARRGIGSPCDESVSCLQVRNGKQRIGCNSVTNTCEAMGLEEVKVLNQSPE